MSEREQPQRASAAALAAPSRERDIDSEAIDERAATTKTQPMARVAEEKRAQPQSKGRTDKEGDQSREESGVFMQDQKWLDFGRRWDEIQSGFVDDPRRTVEQADRLVAEVIAHLSQIFTEERARLEAQWSRGGKAQTEDLRVAMQRYRDFFKTLVGR
jgi:hypothetical protein